MNTYKCRAEAAADVTKMKNALGDSATVKGVKGSDVTIESDLDLAKLRSKMKAVGDDTHRMYQTLNTADKYDGSIVSW